MVDIIPGLQDYVKTEITDKEYENLIKSSRAHGILSKFRGTNL